MVFQAAPTLCRTLLDDPISLERVQALSQEIPGDPGDATVDVGESSATHE